MYVAKLICRVLLSIMIVGFVLRALWLPESPVRVDAELELSQPTAATTIPTTSTPSTSLATIPPSTTDSAFESRSWSPISVKSLTWESQLDRTPNDNSNQGHQAIQLASAELGPIEIKKLPEFSPTATTPTRAQIATIAVASPTRELDSDTSIQVVQHLPPQANTEVSAPSNTEATAGLTLAKAIPASTGSRIGSQIPVANVSASDVGRLAPQSQSEPATNFPSASLPIPPIPPIAERQTSVGDTNLGTSQPTPGVLQNAGSFVMAAQPKIGDHWLDDRPMIDSRAQLMNTIDEDFSPDAVDDFLPYDPHHQQHIYEGKTLNATQRPILELGRPWYQLGQLSPGSTILGKHNPLTPQFLIYGDIRSAVASNTQNGNNVTQSAVEANLDFDLKLTSTERFHAFMSPLDNGVTNTGYLFDENRFVNQFDAKIDFGYFEGDLGAIAGGMTKRTLPFDLPFAVGVMPLVLQNGVWLEDAFLGVAATIPARNIARLGISNMDTTFFAGYDKINSPAFAADDSAARMYGMATFIDMFNGYMEIDYAFLDDRTFDDRSYHNLGFGFTRRYGRLFSNSTRLIVNAGQSTDVVANTADGVLLLSENSLITGAPSTVVPYFNLFAGFDRPQSAARAVQAGGVLRNTGILFETDGMTNYPTLDATANDALGGALGLNLLAHDFSQQLVVEAAWLNTMGNDVNRNADGNQYGLGARYQLPLTNALIFRADAMVGFLEADADIHGVRMELRHKY